MASAPTERLSKFSVSSQNLSIVSTHFSFSFFTIHESHSIHHPRNIFSIFLASLITEVRYTDTSPVHLPLPRIPWLSRQRSIATLDGHCLQPTTSTYAVDVADVVSPYVASSSSTQLHVLSPLLLWMLSTTNPASSITADAPISTGVNVADAATRPPRPTSDTVTRPHLFCRRGSQPTRCAVIQHPFWYELPISSSLPSTNLPSVR